MGDFAVIPALDLKDGLVVHAKAGNRVDYRPVESPFGAADDPAAIARGLLVATGSPSLYVADLDAISGTGNHFELVRGLSYALPGVTLWIDAGFSDVADCAFWLPLGATLVIGSEGLAAVDDWRDIHGAFGESVVLSLDYDFRRQEGSRGVVRRSGALAQPRHRHVPDPGRHRDRPRHRQAQIRDRHGRRPRRVCRRRHQERARSCRIWRRSTRRARCWRRRCTATPSRKTRSPPSCESGDLKQQRSRAIRSETQLLEPPPNWARTACFAGLPPTWGFSLSTGSERVVR